MAGIQFYGEEFFGGWGREEITNYGGEKRRAPEGHNKEKEILRFFIPIFKALFQLRGTSRSAHNWQFAHFFSQSELSCGIPAASSRFNFGFFAKNF